MRTGTRSGETKRGLAVSSLAAVLAALTFGFPSGAKASTTFACDIQGSINANVQWVGGSGSYALNSFAAPCTANDSNGNSATLTLAITSNGSFNNTSCGTGDLTDNAPGVVATNASNPAAAALVNSADLGYRILFSAFQGTLSWQNANPGKPNKVSNLPGSPVGGVAQMYPQSFRDPPPPAGSSTGICGPGFALEAEVGFVVSANIGPTNLAQPPQNTSSPTISGTATQGQTLAEWDGSWTGNPSPTLTRQWERCDSAGNNCLPIPGAVNQSYTLASADVGATIKVAVIAVGAGAATASSAATGVVTAGSGTLPSDLCRGQPGDIGDAIFPQDFLGTAHVAAFLWPESTTKVHLCLRVTAGPAVAGGRLDVDASGAGSLTPVLDASQPDTTPSAPCNQQVHQSPLDHVYVGTTNQVVSVCVMVAGTSKRVDIGVSGSASVPQVIWSKDPDSTV